MKLEELNKRILLIEEEQQAQLQLAQSGKDDYAWKRYKQISEHLIDWGVPDAIAPLLADIAVLSLIALIAVLTDILMRRLLARLLRHAAKKTRTQIDDQLVRYGVFTKLAHAAPALVVYLLVPLWMPTQPRIIGGIQTVALLYLLLIAIMALNALLNAAVDIYRRFAFASQIPIRGFVQVIKIIASALAVIFAISLVIGKSPTLLVSGLGAMTAVLMLVFKDPLIGLIAGIQLSANKMLAIGDWLEMPKYGADGDVIDISLTTVQVQNWDKTISTIPTSALVSDSFKNWRGMSESGGRRIKRDLHIDLATIHFLSPQEVDTLRKAELITEYLQEKQTAVDRYNTEKKIDTSTPVNGRRLTNIGTFRAYLVAYLRNHPEIHDDMTFIVRQLEPTPQGVPIQIYVFVKDVRWANYEAIQSDIFDHILAVIPEFGLRAFQQPSGNDVQSLLAHKTVQSTPPTNMQ